MKIYGIHICVVCKTIINRIQKRVMLNNKYIISAGKMKITKYFPSSPARNFSLYHFYSPKSQRVPCATLDARGTLFILPTVSYFSSNLFTAESTFFNVVSRSCSPRRYDCISVPYVSCALAASPHSFHGQYTLPASNAFDALAYSSGNSI